MPRFVALFRGINVGKAKRIAMADLRALLEKMGCVDVRTLLNSGNAVFTARGTAAGVAQRIRDEVAGKLGVDALVIVKTRADIARIVAGIEITGFDDESRLLVVVANQSRDITRLETLARRPWGDERIQVTRHAAYLWCANGILESSLVPALHAELGARGTTRNWATLKKIHALMADSPRADGR